MFGAYLVYHTPWWALNIWDVIWTLWLITDDIHLQTLSMHQCEIEGYSDFNLWWPALACVWWGASNAMLVNKFLSIEGLHTRGGELATESLSACPGCFVHRRELSCSVYMHKSHNAIMCWEGEDVHAHMFRMHWRRNVSTLMHIIGGTCRRHKDYDSGLNDNAYHPL